MPAERVEMRRVREILRYRFEQGLGHKSIAVRLGLRRRRCARRYGAQRLLACTWPLGDDVSDAVLEAVLYRGAGTKIGHRRGPEPDWRRSTAS
jgi:hypothetical protein